MKFHANTAILLSAIALCFFFALILTVVQFYRVSGRSALQRQPLSRQQAAEGWVKAMDKWDKHRATFLKTTKPFLALGDGEADDPRVLVVYTYAHEGWRYENLEYFVKHGLVGATAEGAIVDYVFVVNGDDEALLGLFDDTNIGYSYRDISSGGGGGTRRMRPTARGRSRNRQSIMVVRRDNVGYDFCAWRAVLEKGLVPWPGKYFRVITMNGSVRGPFLPSYVMFSWVDAFLRHIRGNTKLVGTTVNCVPLLREADGTYAALHLQSMVLAWHPDALRAAAWTFQCLDRMIEVVAHCEVGASRAVFEAGYGARVLQKSFDGIEITQEGLRSLDVSRRCSIISDLDAGDPQFSSVYMGGDVHPYELIFIKTNRHITPDGLARLTNLHDDFLGDSTTSEVQL